MCCCVAATDNWQCTGMQHALSTVYKKIIEYKKIFVELEAIFLFNIRRYKKIEYKKTVTSLQSVRVTSASAVADVVLVALYYVVV